MEAIVQFFVEWGYVGLFLSAFIAGSILPFSSEAVMVILMGMGLDPIGCLIAASLGNTLGGMTCLVAGHGNACDRSARTVGVREIQVVILRVVVVGELTGHALDTHGVATVGVEHAASDRGTRIAVRAHLGPGLVRRIDIALRGKAKHRADKHNQQVQRVDTKAVSIVIGHANSSKSSYTLEAFYPLSRLGFPLSLIHISEPTRRS